MSKQLYMTPDGEIVERVEELAENQQSANLYMEPATIDAQGKLIAGEVFGIKATEAPAENSAEEGLMPATPYYAGHEYKEGRWVANDQTTASTDTNSPSTPHVTPGKLDQESQDALESERATIVRQLPSLTGGAYSKAHSRLTEIEGLLAKARRWAHVERENARRHEERRGQESQGGPAAGAIPMLQELRKTLDAIHRANAPKKTLQEQLDESLKQQSIEFMQGFRRELATNAKPTVCCEGAYLCPKCKAKKAARVA